MAKWSIVLIVFFMASCKKENDLPVYKYIEPQKYLPFWPGSRWEYLRHDNQVFVDSTENNWYLHRYKVDSYPLEYSDPVYVPVFKGAYFYGYQKYYNEYGITFQTVFSENLNDSWQFNWFQSGSGLLSWYTSTVISTNTTDTCIAGIFTDVITIKTHWYYPGSNHTDTFDKFAPNVGKISSISYLNDTVFQYSYQLTSYFINH